MIEHRPLHYTFSGTTEEYSSNRSPVSIASPLEQHYVDGTLSRDILLLLPILESPYSPTQVTVCLHLVNLPDETFGLCNGKTAEICPCCGFSMCKGHTSTRLISLPDAEGVWSEDKALLCTACAALSSEQIYAYHAFRLRINETPCLYNPFNKDIYGGHNI